MTGGNKPRHLFLKATRVFYFQGFDFRILILKLSRLIIGFQLCVLHTSKLSIYDKDIFCFHRKQKCFLKQLQTTEKLISIFAVSQASSSYHHFFFFYCQTITYSDQIPINHFKSAKNNVLSHFSFILQFKITCI